MGLDMYAYATNETPSSPVDFVVTDATEIHYWSKHPNLHGWMRNLYHWKGGSADSFNCVNVRLTEEDLLELEADIKADNLPITQGFFFGMSDGDEMEDDLEFIAAAREALARGQVVYYRPWW